jgi:hypothetical protein
MTAWSAGTESARTKSPRYLAQAAVGCHGYLGHELRDAVDDAGIEVLNMQIDACGGVEETPSQRWFVAGANRFALDDGGAAPAGRLICVSGWLNDQSTPYRLTPTAIQGVEVDG